MASKRKFLRDHQSYVCKMLTPCLLELTVIFCLMCTKKQTLIDRKHSSVIKNFINGKQIEFKQYEY